MSLEVTFRKTGKEIKEAIKNRVKQLTDRLDKRNSILSEFMQNEPKLRSYLIRASQPEWSVHLLNDQVFDLRFEDLVDYGFEANLFAE